LTMHVAYEYRYCDIPPRRSCFHAIFLSCGFAYVRAQVLLELFSRQKSGSRMNQSSLSIAIAVQVRYEATRLRSYSILGRMSDVC
jgi:hypothetical protein